MKPIRLHYGNLAKHGVTPEEVQQCLTPGQRRYLRKVRRRTYLVIKQTVSGRYLEVVYEDRPQELYVFHAMDARPSYIKLLKRRGKRR